MRSLTSLLTSVKYKIINNNTKFKYDKYNVMFFVFLLFFPGGLTQCLKTAYSYFSRTCNSGGKSAPIACHNVALLTLNGQAVEGKPDLTAARQYYEKACAADYAPSCFNLSGLFIEGKSKSFPRDMEQALKYANRACELGHMWGCANASRMYKMGEGTAKDDKKAEELKNRARHLHGLEQERQLKFG